MWPRLAQPTVVAGVAHQHKQLFPCDSRYELQARVSTKYRIVAATALQPGMLPRPAQTLPMHCANASSQLVLPAFAIEVAAGIHAGHRCLCGWDQRCCGGITGVASVVANVVSVAALSHVVQAVSKIKSDPQACGAAAAPASKRRTCHPSRCCMTYITLYATCRGLFVMFQVVRVLPKADSSTTPH